MAADSFAVDLRSLTEFAEELATQLAGMVQPLGQLDALTERELRLGAFVEAQSLGQHHGVAVADLHHLVTQARDAIDFAREVTAMVNDAYQRYDAGVTSAVQSVGGVLHTTGGAVTGTVHGVGGVVPAVGGIIAGLAAPLSGPGTGEGQV
ncbi:hypothetical protein [Plantactinospora sp. B5E13]|uniref:hypothetical protein n=1 Tax=unclassified Plantactinospora TaxID=2631981 RepID=UPI00325F0BED